MNEGRTTAGSGGRKGPKGGGWREARGGARTNGRCWTKRQDRPQLGRQPANGHQTEPNQTNPPNSTLSQQAPTAHSVARAIPHIISPFVQGPGTRVL